MILRLVKLPKLSVPDKGGIYTVVAEDPITFCTQEQKVSQSLNQK